MTPLEEIDREIEQCKFRLRRRGEKVDLEKLRKAQELRHEFLRRAARRSRRDPRC